MNAFFKTRYLSAAAGLSLLIASGARADAVGRLSTRFVARGEKALLEIAVAEGRQLKQPVIPRIDGVEIQAVGSGSSRPVPGRRQEFIFAYLVSSYQMGLHTLPAFEVESGGVPSRTEPLDFTVFDPNDLVWNEATAGGATFRYASTFKVLNDRPFAGETTPVEIKLYVPQDQVVVDWGNPDLQRNGITAWRFQSSSMRGEVNLLGKPYYSVAYPSTLTATRPGNVGISQATVRLVTSQVILDGFQRRVAEEVNLTVPDLKLDAQPLPPGAPQGFENAVGDFRLEISTSTTEVQEGDPIAVDIVVRGSGNLDTVRPPRPVDTGGWKIYEPTTELRGDERRELSGFTVFHQFLRPLELKPEIPSFRLVFFDPKKKSYQTVLTEPVGLRMKPAVAAAGQPAGPPKALPIPVERMTDILGLAQADVLTVSPQGRLPAWWLHALGGGIAGLLLLKILWMRNARRFRKDPRRERMVAALKELEKQKSASDIDFLMAAGAFVESRLPDRPPEIEAILKERDAVCFIKDKPSGDVLPKGRREAVMKVLRAAALSCLALWIFGPGISEAADSRSLQAREAYDSARYDDAVGIWLGAGPYTELSADTLYNVGNACYRAGSPGQAALYYRRAIARDSSHLEARQNLRFIERKYGSLTVQRPDYQHALARIPLGSWQNLTWAGLWLFGLSVLVFPATRPGANVRIAAIACMVIGPLLASCAALGWHYFPTDAEFAPADRQAVITGDKVIVHTEASRTSTEVIDAPPGSLCEVLQTSGRWVYLSFASKTRGWVPTESVEKVLPEKPPAPPKIRKPKADGKTA
jgi:tetratricopeptide (TPR) repeat protein